MEAINLSLNAKIDTINFIAAYGSGAMVEPILRIVWELRKA